jgi:hypothetical protein
MRNSGPIEAAQRRLLVGGLVVMAAVCSGSRGGTLRGIVREAGTQKPIRRVVVRAYEHGRSVAISTMTENDGSYIFSDVPPGSYAVCVAAEASFRAICAADIEVNENGATELNLQARRSVAVVGDSWLQAHQSFAQSYRAGGLALTALQIKAYGPARRVRVEVVEGDDAGGPAIGPARITEPVGGEGTTGVAWGGDEIPTTPGRVYTIRMSAVEADGWIPGVAGRGDVYGQGMAYFDGSPRPHTDLGIVVCEDDDGCRTSYGLLTAKRMYRAVSVGQVFEATSRNICYARARLKGIDAVPNYVRFSIHEDKPGGRQIGPSKAVAAEGNAVVAWGSKEVPVKPGREYYLHVESLTGREFLAAYQDDSYSGGAACFNGQIDGDKDLTAIVTGMTTEADSERLMAHPCQRGIVELSSPSFEDGVGKWRCDDQHGSVVGCDGGVVPYWVTRMFGWTNRKQGQDTRTVVYQKVNVAKGRRYSFSGWVYTDQRGGRSSDVKARLIALPAGGGDVRKSEMIESSQWYATAGCWRRGSVEFVAEANTVTVGFDLEQRFSLESNSLYVDGASLQWIEDQ